MYTLSEIASVINATILQKYQDTLPIEHLLLDSRKLLFPDTSLFFALGGQRRSGNSFIAELYAKGVKNFVVDESITKSSLQKFNQANFLQVKNVLQALQDLTAYHRKRFEIPVIGITGSNGKTIVKEWLYQLLVENYSIVRSPKSYNSQIGVPLSVWQMNQQHTLGIFEVGISKPNEMELLEKVIQPTIGIFTNIGEAHSEGFVNIHQKVTEKLKLFVHSELLIYNADDVNIQQGVDEFRNSNTNNSLTLFTWGKNENATLHITSIEKNGWQTNISANYSFTGKININIPFTDEAYIENAINCLCVLLYLGIEVRGIAERIQKLRPVEMRLELKQGINHCSVINDSYSTDINSLTIALDFLLQQQQHSKRTVILSDILQSGKSSESLYAEVAFILEQKKINRFIGIGPEISKHSDVFKNIEQINFYISTDDFRKNFHAVHFYNETILLKGARVFEFETINHLLEEKVHQTVLEINLNAVTHNVKQYQQYLNPGVKLMAMVKAFSYGSGSFEIANLLQFHKIDYLAVAYADEGVELRKGGISLPVMVMSPEENTFDVMVQYNLEPELYSFNILDAFQQYLQRSGIKHYPVHIKINTGMNRLGFDEVYFDELAEALKTASSFKVQSVFSHLAASGSKEHQDFTKQQASILSKASDKIQQVLDYSFIRHISNTSAIEHYRDLQLDMVRLGIGMYGVDDDKKIQQQLKNVTTLKTTVAQVRKISAGETVGYNRAGKVEKESMIATVRIGYADGYPRRLSNGAGKMWVNGKLAPVVGNICMDMTMLDVTGIDIKEGDDVIVFGEELPVSDVAEWAGTIAYEILAGMSQRVKRVYYEE